MGCGGSGVSCKAAAASPSHVSGSRLNRFFYGTCGRPPATRVEAWTGPGHLVRTSNPNSRPKWLRGTAQKQPSPSLLQPTVRLPVYDSTRATPQRDRTRPLTCETTPA